MAHTRHTGHTRASTAASPTSRWSHSTYARAKKVRQANHPAARKNEGLGMATVQIVEHLNALREFISRLSTGAPLALPQTRFDETIATRLELAILNSAPSARTSSSSVSES